MQLATAEAIDRRVQTGLEITKPQKQILQFAYHTVSPITNVAIGIDKSTV